MNNQWVKILVFSLISFGLGFLICCYCCGRGCHRHGGCGDGDRGCAMRDGCEHGEMKGDCCKGEGHGEGHGYKNPMGAQAMALEKQLKDSNYQGDTTIAIEGGTLHYMRKGGRIEVRVEMNDSLKVEEKTVEVY